MNRTARRALTALPTAVVLAAALPVATAAAAPAPADFADVIGAVQVDHADPSVARVLARYRCTAETVDHDGFSTPALWVSVKQTADRTADPRLAQEGSSSISAAMSHSHRNPVTCDGRVRTQQFVVDQQEWGFGALAKGEGYVQFCLTLDLTEHGTVSQNEFVHVR